MAAATEERREKVEICFHLKGREKDGMPNGGFIEKIIRG